LERSGPLPAAHARHGDDLVPGRIFVAPPDHHLLVQDSRVVLSRGPRENRYRPAVDALFRSAARSYGPRAIGVVLSGALDDGASGAAAIAAQDGTVLVQSPQDARVPGMPNAVLATVRRARAAPADGLAALIATTVGSIAGTVPTVSIEGTVRTEPAQEAEMRDDHAQQPGPPAALGCPDCQGGMFEVDDAPVTYVCHVGHRWAAQSLLSAEQEAVEGALYNAASKLLEQATVHLRIAETGTSDPHRLRHLELASRARRHADLVQSVIDEVSAQPTGSDPHQDENGGRSTRGLSNGE
jgi:two-component system chemotaxis response regulator CheB